MQMCFVILSLLNEYDDDDGPVSSGVTRNSWAPAQYSSTPSLPSLEP